MYNYSYFVSGDLSYRTCIISYHMSTWVCCDFVVCLFVFLFQRMLLYLLYLFFKLYFVMQNVYICNTSFYCYKINFKKRKNLHVEQFCMYILRQHCTKMSVKNNTSCLFSIYVYANITLLMNILKYVSNVSFFNISTLHICNDIKQVY